MKKAAIIVAGGSGIRMGGEVPKQFQLIGGKPVVLWSLTAFYNFDPEIHLILVLPQEHIDLWERLREEFKPAFSVTVVAGGAERYHSVQNGLTAITDEDIIAIHDGVRPFIDSVMINRCFDAAHKTGTAIPVIESVDSIRILIPDGSRPLKRRDVKRVQTPQVFRREVIQKAYSQLYKDCFTDEATVCEMAGFKTTLIEGNKLNLKITTPEDMMLADIIASRWNN
ncbi:2-C-methyl-D-erythritol 4-phosphate cytidylyltransferase [Williamwhitmania taraxaci]|uniref:2-C-methyl-D-erythritol 4-phosphate cytidylyltransferase n=1 Tax=Williamwhitmania taraxaci TaxID=1640674 RepID=A0A1G6U1I4_9BACT|nr:2-C-methyl-D-erythritol 4-phosphate cytidylyltransferase [Williamwhitmania taraxaci]SDD35173.1 2-C-methyl-D-erythritol 4-phosphate cytidylyltransferase [Williamwhitmania taraxaci]